MLICIIVLESTSVVSHWTAVPSAGRHVTTLVMTSLVHIHIRTLNVVLLGFARAKLGQTRIGPSAPATAAATATTATITAAAARPSKLLWH